MSEFRISIVGRARVGKSLLLTRFVKKPEDIEALSNSGSDSTKVPTELILRDDITSTSIECHYKDENKGNKSVSNLAEFHEKVRVDVELRERISHIVIKAEPSEWARRVLRDTNTTQLVIIDTEGVSGDVKKLNMRNWKVNLFILLLNSANKSEFAESIRKMKPALLGNSIWYAVSMQDWVLPPPNPDYENQLDSQIKAGEATAKKIKEAFSDELNNLEDEKSLLSMKLSDFKRKDTILAIPNITLSQSWLKNCTDYVDKKLEEFLSDAIKNNGEDIDIEIDTGDVKKKASAMNLLQRLSDTAMYAFENEKIKNIKPVCNESTFKSRFNREYRLKSYDKGYLVEKQWQITSSLRAAIYEKINEIKADERSSLSLMEQAALAQKFYSNFANKIIWTNYFVSTIDGREGTEQASIILMLHAADITKELNTTETPVKDILDKVIKTDEGWEKNYLIDEDRNSISYVPVICASKVTNIKDVFEKFYELVIKPYTIYAMNYTSLKLGYKTGAEVINEYCIKHSN